MVSLTALFSNHGGSPYILKVRKETRKAAAKKLHCCLALSPLELGRRHWKWTHMTRTVLPRNRAYPWKNYHHSPQPRAGRRHSREKLPAHSHRTSTFRSTSFKLFLKKINIFYLFFYFNFFYFYCCSSIGFCLFPPPQVNTPALPTSLPFPPPHAVNRPCVLYNYSCKPFTLFPWNSLHSTLWSLSACFQFQCLWLYFACLFVLLIRFLLEV